MILVTLQTLQHHHLVSTALSTDDIRGGLACLLLFVLDVGGLWRDYVDVANEGASGL